MIDISRIRAVFFDVGNTLVFPDWNVFFEPLQPFGAQPDPELIAEVERQAKPAFDAYMLSSDPVFHDRTYWQTFFRLLLERLGLAEHAPELIPQLCARSANSANWKRTLNGTGEALRRIAGKYRIAVISNADGRIEACLRNAGVCPPFESITDSGLAGTEKPHPRIFEMALAGMNVAAGESLYVGDLYTVDYRGATGAGMQGVLMDVHGCYIPAGHPRVGSLHDLMGLLQV